MAADWASHSGDISKVLGNRIKRGVAMHHEDYIAALRLGEDCRNQLASVFGANDVLIAPCVKGEAPRGLESTGDPAFQAFWTILYVPTVTLPTHRGPNGLPVGLQVIAPRYEDERLFACARWIFDRLGAG
jgi:amidase